MRKDGAMPETILLLQDNASKAAIVRETLVKSSDPPFVVEWVRSCAAALDRLRDQTRDHITAVLIDLLLPDGQEFEIFDQIFQASPHIPILVLSIPDNEEVPRQAVQHGAQDYTVELSGSCVLIRRDGIESGMEDSGAPIHDRRGQVTGAVMVFHDVTQAREMSERMSYLAHHDYLTGLPNRLLLDDRLAQAMAAARRQRQQMAGPFLALGRFTHTTPSHGHSPPDP